MPPDTLLHWATVKASTEGSLTDYKVLYVLKREEAETCGETVLAMDSTIVDLRATVSNDSAVVADKDRQYGELKRRTVPKSALPWYVVAAFIVGYLLAK